MDKRHWHRHPVPPSSAEEGPPPASQPEPHPLPATNLERPPDCINRHSTPHFSLLCTMMDRLRTEEASKRRDILARFMELWRIKVGNDLYPLIRLLLPDRDRERPVYNLKEAMLAKCYIEVLGLDRHSDAALRLIKWKQPVDGQAESHSGDFARVCYYEISARSTVEQGQLSIEAVNALLDQLATGRLKQQDYVPILRKINQQCTAAEQEWIIRIILKDLRISIREKGVFACFHPDAADLFNVCSDLKRVCWTLYKPNIRLEKNQTHIELFRSFLPQLCYRSPSSSHEAIAKLVGGPNTEFIMEEKLDGERMQLHMRGSGAQWFYCSRKAKDYTYLYGAHIGEGSLTQHIAGAFQDDVRNIILDGEMLVWDPILEKYLAFGTLKTAAGDRVNDENAPRPCFKIFDILYLNDRCLTHKRLSERKRLMRSNRIFRDMNRYKGRLEYADEQTGKTGRDIRAMLERILETKGEGLVVKKNDSVYLTNSRGADWIKVKPEYSDQMGENLDLLVLGGWWGKGGRTGKISSLLCGLRVQQEDDGSVQQPEFTTFASVGSGMSYEDYEWILNKHKHHWKNFDRNNPPKWMQLGVTGLDDKPDVYIEPENSFVIEVKASEIVPAVGNYGCGYTLRFPRCRYIYFDKASRDHPTGDDSQDRDMWNAVSHSQFMALLNKPKKRYADDENGSRQRKRRKVPVKKKVSLMTSARGQKLSEDLVESNILRDLTFYIPKGSAAHPKAELEALVHKHGAEFTQAQLADLSALVISPDEKHPLVRAQIRKGVSVLKPDWIFESIRRRRPLPMLKDLLVHASEEAEDDRYYHKTLEEIDQVSLVRDRTGNQRDEEESVEEPEQDEVVEGDYDGEEEKIFDHECNKTEQQVKLEEEWGLRRSPKPMSSRSTSRAGSVEESDTDSERRKVDYKEEDEADDSHESEPEEEGGNFRLLPVRGVDTSEHDGMGEDSNAMNYDEDSIFHHLVFYIDSPENATRNGLSPSVPSEATRQRLSEAEKLLRENGGRISLDINDKKLTHIIMDDDDSGRYAEIVRKTSEPKRKHIVLPSWVTECVDEETLMNEDGEFNASHRPGDLADPSHI
ncbi:DNA ligase 4 [Kwoniella heveanensis BCC8398]|uniref:DNA ligase n=1 Tax=Kwoniella heveanensis BCC8398 TaxID=1296120 RepID=A0A1B9GJN7_9TREE|nr:DNA ligase 4 [Kwoniella heveanensis BCC8398]